MLAPLNRHRLSNEGLLASMSTQVAFRFKRKSRFWVTAGFLLIVFLAGGSARSDVFALALLRPLAILLAAAALLTLAPEALRRFRVLFALLFSLVLLTAIHLLPLPPSIWHALPGRDALAEIDAMIGMKDAWRPISTVPARTLNSLFALSVPFAALALAAGLSREYQFALLRVLLVLGLLTGLLAILQISGGADSAFYLYPVSNFDSGVGLFANRNHQAAFLACLYPMLAAYASQKSLDHSRPRFRLIVALTAGTLLVPLLLITGSRAGVLLGLLGLGTAPFVYGSATATGLKPRWKSSYRLAALAAGGLGALILLTLLAVFFSRSEGLERLLQMSQQEDMRMLFWPVAALAGWEHFPVGSGIGTFVEAFQRFEPDSLLSPIYVNHAHNDLLEIFITGGLPLLALAGIAAVAWFYATFRAWRSPPVGQQIVYARMASVILLILATASLVDYPLRTPALACFAMIASVWLADPIKKLSSGRSGATLRKSDSLAG